MPVIAKNYSYSGEELLLTIVTTIEMTNSRMMKVHEGQHIDLWVEFLGRHRFVKGGGVRRPYYKVYGEHALALVAMHKMGTDDATLEEHAKKWRDRDVEA